MDVYSALLLMGIVVVVVAAVAAVASRASQSKSLFVRTARTGGALATTLTLAAIGFHFARGHTPGSVEALSFADFVIIHPAPFVTMLFGLLCIWLGAPRSSPPREEV